MFDLFEATTQIFRQESGKTVPEELLCGSSIINDHHVTYVFNENHRIQF